MDDEAASRPLRRAALQIAIFDAVAVAIAIGVCISIGRISALDLGTALFWAGGLILCCALLPLIGTFTTFGSETSVFLAGTDARWANNMVRQARQDTRNNVSFALVCVLAGLPLVVTGVAIVLFA